MEPTPPPPAPRYGAPEHASPQHPAPPDGWRPLSGLCLAAFVLALVLGLLSLMTLWPPTLLPLVLSCVALCVVDGKARRGRPLAWAALIVSLVLGAFGLAMTRLLHDRIDRIGSAMVSVLEGERPEERKATLGRWLAGGADRTATLERFEKRWRQAEERLGPAAGGVTRPSMWWGQFPIMVPPSGVVAVDDPDSVATLPGPGDAVWVKVPFQKGPAHLALWLGDGSPTGLAQALTDLGASNEPSPVVRDLRLFAPRALLEAGPEKR